MLLQGVIQIGVGSHPAVIGRECRVAVEVDVEGIAAIWLDLSSVHIDEVIFVAAIESAAPY